MVLEDMYARERFLFWLEWLLALESRYSNILQSGLVRITLDRHDVFGLTYDAGDTALKLSEVKDCLKQAFRRTDLVARDGLNFWILTPFTQSDPVIEKIRKVIKTAPLNGLSIAKSDIDIFLLRDHLKPGIPAFKTGQDFLAYLLLGQAPIILSPAVTLPGQTGLVGVAPAEGGLFSPLHGPGTSASGLSETTAPQQPPHDPRTDR